LECNSFICTICVQEKRDRKGKREKKEKKRKAGSPDSAPVDETIPLPQSDGTHVLPNVPAAESDSSRVQQEIDSIQTLPTADEAGIEYLS